MNDDVNRRAYLRRRVIVMATAVISGQLAACSSDRGRSNGDGNELPAGRGESTAAATATEAGEANEKPTNATVVVLTPAAAATANILVEDASLEAVPGADAGIEVPGQVDFEPTRVALISPRTSGRVERLGAAVGQRVAAGQVVALLYSPAFVTAQNDFLQAKRRAATLEGTADASGARALLGAARRRLELLGASDGTIRAIETNGEVQPLLPVVAPFQGSILESSTITGAAVEAGAALFRLADLSVVIVTAAVPERAAFALRVGQSAQIRVAAAPDRTFSGRVTRVADQINPTTRTLEAFLQVSNLGRLLKPGMSAIVVLRLRGDGAASVAHTLTIPASAVVTDGGERFVFVEVAPHTYERRDVQLGSGVARGMGPRGRRVVVTSGLSPGDNVVVRGAFTLKSELAKASFAEDEH